MPDAALVGHPGQSRQSFQCHNSFHPPGVAGKAPAATWRLRHGGRFWSWFQRGILVAAMDVSVIAFLILLVLVAVLRLVELRISRRHQQELIARGAAKINEPRFRWMVLLH